MATSRHGLAHTTGSLLFLALPLAIAASLACQPTRRPRLEVTQLAELVEGQVHFVVRADPTTLSRADAVVLTLTTVGGSIAAVPDDPGATGASSERSVSLEVGAPMSMHCLTSGVCEAGFTAFVEGDASNVQLALTAASSSDEPFRADARLALEVDGQPAAFATRQGI